MNVMKADMVKIRFDLEQDQDGYPPASVEYIWAKPVGKHLYEIDNIPFFAKGVSINDIVKAKQNPNDELSFQGIDRSSGHSTIRLIIYDEHNIEQIRTELGLLGCSTEKSHIKGLISVDIPKNLDFQSIMELIKRYSIEEKLDYEEACIAHRN